MTMTARSRSYAPLCGIWKRACEYAEVSLRCEYVAELVHDGMAETRESVKRAAETTAKAVEAAERGMEETMSAFLPWAARLSDAREARLTLRFDDHIDAGQSIREGFRIWQDAGLPEERYRKARVLF